MVNGVDPDQAALILVHIGCSSIAVNIYRVNTVAPIVLLTWSNRICLKWHNFWTIVMEYLILDIFLQL